MKKQNNIAIDGHSSCGKGTLAKYLAKELGYSILDTGAMYRAVTFAIQKKNIDLKDIDGIKTLLISGVLQMELTPAGLNLTFNNEDISNDIRLPKVSSLVSQVSELSIVRKFLVGLQQQMAENGKIVMDGRDIGTNVLPNAALKIFMTAQPKIRAQRRFEELNNKGVDVSFDQVYENILFRDKTDSSREHNPLIVAEDAKVLDNSEMSIERQNEIALEWAKDALPH